jgi:hypothetical protein
LLTVCLCVLRAILQVAAHTLNVAAVEALLAAGAGVNAAVRI